jgi:hypothetical protein
MIEVSENPILREPKAISQARKALAYFDKHLFRQSGLVDKT